MKTAAKRASILVSLVMALSIFAVSVLAATGTIKTKTAGSSITMRKSASTSASSLAKIKDGSKIEIVSKTKDGKWYKIKYNNKTGYVQKDYVTVGSSTTATSASSDTLTGTVLKKSYFYKTASTKGTKVGTVAKGESVTITKQTKSYYQIKTSKGKSGYIVKANVRANAAVVEYKPGDKMGVYTNAAITKPASVANSKEELWNAISYHLTQFETSFTVTVSKNYNGDWMPTKMSALEYSYVDGNIDIEEANVDDKGQIAFKFKAAYNEAGRLIKSLRDKKELSASDTKALELKAVVDKALKEVDGKSAYQKVVGLHDFVVKTAAYDDDMSKVSYSAYGSLVKGKASCQGYMEAFGLLASAAGIENRCVWANSRMEGGTGSHGFNKVKIDGKWYNVDCTVDDQKPDVKGRALKTYLLVTDKVSQQRYQWDTTRYPASKTDNNWHKRNKLVATSQSSLESLVKAGAQKKEKYISVWVADYSKNSSKYNTAFAKKISGVKSVKVTVTGAADSVKNWGTAILFTMSY